ncbi:OLC1v1029465C1 [Oldenlandia corymbosa var. corymbosa]|uniref:OLC1v1029465C1 n=1 Tax=Oldenlandia corymbosa var. corymbosa TaxID=529605 RepID=A0AAV1CDX8_OLDCO|nr:OLC1v1029465C1 [Oldenlandia corymbosa var. corymbosa]
MADLDDDHYQRLDCVAEKINKLGQDWFFLQMFVSSTYYSDVEEIMEIRTYFFLNICGGVAEKILRYFNLETSQEVPSMLSYCQTKTDELIETQIRDALKDLPISQVLPRGCGVVVNNIALLCGELEMICRYLRCMADFCPHEDTFGDAHSVVQRIVFRSCSFWFGRNDPETANATAVEIVSLLREIDPTNLEFLQSHLTLLEASYKLQDRYGNRGCVNVVDFCNYLLNGCDTGIGKELSSLVTLYIENELEAGEEVMHNLVTEILSLLAEAAFPLHILQQDLVEDGDSVLFTRELIKPNVAAALPSCSELRSKVCLLRAELFLKRQLVTPNASMLFNDDRFFKVNMILTDLGAFTKDLSQQENTEFVRQTLVLAEELENEIESLQKSLLSKKTTGPFVKLLLLQLLFRIVFFKADSFLAELLKSGDIVKAHKRDEIQYLVEELDYFKVIVKMKLASNPSNEAITQLEVVVGEMTLLSYIVHSLPQLNIKEFRKQEFESITPIKYRIEEVLLHLESLMLFLLQVKDANVKLGELKNLRNHIIEAAYKLEYVVEAIEVDGHLQESLWLYDVLEDIRRLDQQISKISEVSHASQVENLPQISLQTVSRDSTPEINEILVDLDDEENVIVDRLTKRSSLQDVVSIVGMPGIGKSTLARKVFNNPNVVCYFHRRSWCTVSQTYSKRELLLELLSHIDVLTKDINKMTDDDLLSKLRRYLLKIKYLIVMDDIWDNAAWNDLEYYFPDDRNGIRILITSRRQDVASRIKADSDSHPVRPLSDVES